MVESLAVIAHSRGGLLEGQAKALLDRDGAGSNTEGQAQEPMIELLEGKVLGEECQRRNE